MHGIGAHSALAIKRQRRRNAKGNDRHRKRRGSQSQTEHYEADNKVMGTITMFHVGAIFLLLSCILMLGAVMTSESKKETAELVGTGIICLIIGLFLIILNRFYGQKEEENLASYVEQRLGRSRSGQRLYHEQESMDHLGPSASASVESEISREMSSKGKKGKKNKKGNKDGGGAGGGIEETGVVNGADPKVKTEIVNEHNQYRNHHNDISSANVNLERIAEESRSGDNYHQNQPISYVNAKYEENNKAANNLYRVYDYSQAGGAV